MKAQPSAMKRVYAALLCISLGLIFGIVEKQGDPLRERRETKIERLALTLPCSAWICKGGYLKCQDVRNRQCTTADLRRE